EALQASVGVLQAALSGQHTTSGGVLSLRNRTSSLPVQVAQGVLNLTQALTLGSHVTSARAGSRQRLADLLTVLPASRQASLHLLPCLFRSFRLVALHFTDAHRQLGQLLVHLLTSLDNYLPVVVQSVVAKDLR